MPSQGTFDPTGFVSGNASTYPQPAAGTLYQPGMWWDVDPAGTFAGQPASLGDRIYVTGTGRLYGQIAYGDGVYGGQVDRDWLADNVTFKLWVSTLPPSLTDPYPYAGCPLGDRYPGWRFIVDAHYNDVVGSRTYGTGTYGDDVFGDAGGAVDHWVDITEGNYSATITRGTPTGDWAVDVDQIIVEFHDPTGDIFEIAAPASWYRPQPGTSIRVGVADPALTYYPLACGEIERIIDDHDTQPRYVTVEAFGFQMDLVSTLSNWRTRSGLAIQTEVARLLAAASWRWGTNVVDYPTTGGPVLLGDYEPVDVVARDQLDMLAISAGWSTDTTKRGDLRMREWPLDAAGGPIVVTDCPDDPSAPPGALTASDLRFLADYDAMLNVVEMTNVAQTHLEAIDWPSVGQHGRRSENFGFPLTSTYTLAADMQSIADRIIDRLGPVVVHLDGVAVDTWVDDRWVRVLAELDTGDELDVYRVGLPNALTLSTVVVGYEHRMSPNRWRSKIATRTTTQGAP